jgi:hypothetical protein
VSGTTYTSAYTYDKEGNRNTITYPSGRVVDYSFDYADRPYSAASGATSYVTSASYLPFGPATQLVFGNGTTQTMQYDARYRPSENQLAAGMTSLADYTYTSDALGNITAIHDALDATRNRDFAYDDLNRLVTANSGTALWGTGAYTYDPMGNMLTLGLGAGRTASFSYSGTLPKLTGVTENGVSRGVTYDSAGNEVAVGTAATAVSSRNQVIAADDAAYTYDGRGIRTTLDVPLYSLAISPSSPVMRTTATATITMPAAAPSGGAVITLSSSNTDAVTGPVQRHRDGGQHDRHLHRDHLRRRLEHERDSHRHVRRQYRDCDRCGPDRGVEGGFAVVRSGGGLSRRPHHDRNRHAVQCGSQRGCARAALE